MGSDAVALGIEKLGDTLFEAIAQAWYIRRGQDRRCGLTVIAKAGLSVAVLAKALLQYHGKQFQGKALQFIQGSGFLLPHGNEQGLELFEDARDFPKGYGPQHGVDMI